MPMAPHIGRTVGALIRRLLPGQDPASVAAMLALAPGQAPSPLRIERWLSAMLVRRNPHDDPDARIRREVAAIQQERAAGRKRRTPWSNWR